jgi:hypothetical protein
MWAPINVEKAREILDYDPVSGFFFWKIKTCDKVIVGTKAGCEATGPDGRRYIKIRYDGRLYQAHRLAWAYVHGLSDFRDIDHKDGDGLNNAITNLREATQSQNSANMRKTIKSSTGYRGVYPYGTTGLKFEAKAMKDYKSIRFGVFSTPEEAYEAYCEGLKSVFGQFASLV